MHWLSILAGRTGGDRRRHILYIVLLGLGLPALLYGLISSILWLTTSEPFAQLGVWAGFGVLPFYLLSYWLGQRGHLRLAAYIPTVLLFLLMTGVSYQLGIGHAMLIGYAMVVLVAGALIGGRAALVFAALCTISNFVIGNMQATGRLLGAISPLANHTTDTVAISMCLPVIVIFQWFSDRELRLSLLSEQRSRAQAERLLNASRSLSAALELGLVLDTILSELRAIVPFDSASVQRMEGDWLEIIGGHGFPNLDELIGTRFNLQASDNPNRQVIESCNAMILGDAPAHYEQFTNEPHAAAGIRSWLGVPLLYGDQLLGMLALDKKEPGFYSQEHARLTLAFASQAAIAIENARAHDRLEEQVTTRTQELERANNQLAALMRLSYTISANLDIETILETSYRAVGELMPNDAFWIASYEQGSDVYQNLIKIDRGERCLADAIHLDNGIGGEAIRTKRPVLVDASVAGRLQNFGGQHRVQSVLCVPLLIGERVVGALSTQSYTPNAYSPEEVDLLVSLAQPVAIALENARLYSELEQYRDHLEGLVQERAAELHAIVAALPDLYFRVGANGVYLDYHAGKASDLFVPPETFLGKSMHDVLPPPDCGAIR